jgi:hypothetical protein
MIDNVLYHSLLGLATPNGDFWAVTCPRCRLYVQVDRLPMAYPAPKSQSCLLGQGSPDRDLSFFVTYVVKLPITSNSSQEGSSREGEFSSSYGPTHHKVGFPANHFGQTDSAIYHC